MTLCITIKKGPRSTIFFNQLEGKIYKIATKDNYT